MQAQGSKAANVRRVVGVASLPAQDSYVQDIASGLYLPPSLIKARQDAQEQQAQKERGKFFASLSPQAQREARGRFFSQYGKAERWNQAGAQEKPPDEPSFMYLRGQFSDSLIDQIIVMRRQQQVRSVARRVRNPETELGWRVVHVDHDQPDFEETDEIRRRCAEMEDLLENGPTPEVHPGGLSDFLVAAVQEQLIVDRKAMVCFKDRTGAPRQFHLIDGTTIKPVSRVLWEWLEQQNRDHVLDQFGPSIWAVAAATLSEELGVDLTRAAWIQEVDGGITGAWTPDQMSVDITSPSVEINRLAYGYGSCFQRSKTATDLLIDLWQYNQGLMDIDYPEQALFLFGDYSPQGLEAFTRQITSQVGRRNWSRLAVIPSDLEFKADVKKLRETPKDMLWDRLLQVLLAVKCAAYGMHPSEINVEGFGDGEASLNEPKEETQIAERKEEGFHGLLQDQADWLNRAIVMPRNPDLRMVWVTSRDTEQARVQINVERTASYGTINEARVAENKPPLKEEWADQPLWAAQITLQSSAQAQVQQQGMEQQARIQERQSAQQQVGEAESQQAEHEHEERLATMPKPEQEGPNSPTGKASTRPRTQTREAKAASAGVRMIVRTHGAPQRMEEREPESSTLRIRVRGRTYTVKASGDGATYRAPNGAIVLHSDRVPMSPEEAVRELETALEEAGGVPA